MATATKTSLKKRIRTASDFIALIPPRLLRQVLANVFAGIQQILKACIKVQEKKKKVVVFNFCSRPRQNVNLGNFTL